MKTYSESQGKKPFNWNEFLNRKNITDDEWFYAMKLADNWVTCACGNQCEVIERDIHSGSPLDSELMKLGHDFYIDIKYKNKYDAKETLKKIEKRSAFLIERLNH